jgi:hypothetical protein
MGPFDGFSEDTLKRFDRTVELAERKYNQKVKAVDRVENISKSTSDRFRSVRGPALRLPGKWTWSTLDQTWPKPRPLSPDWLERNELEFDRAQIQWLEDQEEWRKYEARLTGTGAGVEIVSCNADVSAPIRRP